MQKYSTKDHLFFFIKKTLKNSNLILTSRLGFFLLRGLFFSLGFFIESPDVFMFIYFVSFGRFFRSSIGLPKSQTIIYVFKRRNNFFLSIYNKIKNIIYFFEFLIVNGSPGCFGKLVKKGLNLFSIS